MDAVIAADLIILLLVLILPLASHWIEHNLESFLFVMGLASALAAGVLDAALVRAALTHPFPITLAVLISGLLFAAVRRHISGLLVRLLAAVPMRVLVGGHFVALFLV